MDAFFSSLHRLTRRDVLNMEQQLRASLAGVLSFAGHAVYFPQDNEPVEPLWLEEEGTLLLPLWQESPATPGASDIAGVPDSPHSTNVAGATERELLGVFAARQVTGMSKDLLAVLPGIARLCLENMSLYKLGRLDLATGIATRHVLIGRISQEIAAVQSAFASGEDSPSGGSFGVLAVRLAPLRQVAREHGQTFTERLGRELAAACTAVLPEGCLAARSGDTGFAVFLPAGTRSLCEQTAAKMLTALDAIRVPSPLSRREVGVAARIGFSLYPQDMDGVVGERLPHEQAQRLIQRAARAAAVAADSESPLRIMGYGKIVQEGGTVLRSLPLSRLVISLGRAVGAREGQRFAVWAQGASTTRDLAAVGSHGRAPVYKGELSLVKVHQEESEAEILHLGAPDSPPAAGDALTLLPNSGDAEPSSHSDHPLDPDTALLRHGEFLARLSAERGGHSRMALALLHVEVGQADPRDVMHRAADALRTRFDLESGVLSLESAKLGEPSELSELRTSGELDSLDRAESLADSSSACPSTAGISGSMGRAVLGGRYGHHTLCLLHVEADPTALHAAYEELARGLARDFACTVGAGIASWPFLHFRPADLPECGRKALEYAMLLPPPHVGLFGSLALNISADKRHCLGDAFGAIEEYKLALLADANNALAWNSLGVCMAGLGRHAEARHHFEQALALTPNDAALAYNLGAVCLNLGDTPAAEGYFQCCLTHEPEHLYALVRLGQTAEQRGDTATARDFYLQAASAEQSGGLPFTHLARLSLREHNASAAREHLHQALQRNPRDALALHMMASLYLDGGEDPHLAESLARNSLALQPDRKSAWLTLARALESQGRTNDAQHARLRAAEL